MKIIIDKKEGIADVADRLLNVDAQEVTLVVPRGTQLLESPANFRLLAHEAETLGKRVVVESVDEEVLAMAKAQDIEAVHPLFGEQEQGHRAMSDIVPPSHARQHNANASTESNSVAADKDVDEEIEKGAKGYTPPKKQKKKRRSFSFPRLRMPGRWWVVAVAIVVVVVLLGWGVSAAFGSATVVLHFNKVPWEYNVKLAAAPEISSIDIVGNQIPGEFIESEKNTTQFFAASGRSQVEQRATGRITIYNTFSSQSQVLVATTRFLTPDGKLFRLDERVVVPGAEIESGEVVPSSIEASVTADQPGEEYNVGPTDRLTIPGFKESGLTARYEGFYGALHDGASGGFIGEKAVPTEEDVARAKQRVEESLLSSFEVTFLNNIPDELVVLDEAKDVVVVDLTVNENTNEEGKFSLLGRARLRAMAFKRSDVEGFLEQELERSFSDWDLKDVSIEYDDIDVDLDERTLSLRVSAQAVRMPEFDAGQFVGQISGKSEDEARELIQSLPELVDARLQLWPAWVRNIPSSANDVSVTVE